MNLFEKILEIKTWKKNLAIKAVYVPNSTSDGEWTYFVYYYDIFAHTFYINDIDNTCSNRTSAINIIEHIANEAFQQSMNAFTPPFKKLFSAQEPTIFCLYLQKQTNEVIIDTIKLQTIKEDGLYITGFKNPKWDRNLETTLQRLGLKKSRE